MPREVNNDADIEVPNSQSILHSEMEFRNEIREKNLKILRGIIVILTGGSSCHKKKKRSRLNEKSVRQEEVTRRKGDVVECAKELSHSKEKITTKCEQLLPEMSLKLCLELVH